MNTIHRVALSVAVVIFLIASLIPTVVLRPCD